MNNFFKITPIIYLILFSCNDSSKICYKETGSCYKIVQLKDSLTGDTLSIKYRYTDKKVFIVQDDYYEKSKVLHEYLFVDTNVNKGDMQAVYSSSCYGKLCEFYSNPGKGYIIIMLEKKNNMFLFKHVVLDSIFSSTDYIDSAQLKKINSSPVLNERYYSGKLANGVFLIDNYKNVEGKLGFNFSY